MAHGTVPLVGRRAELATVDAALERATNCATVLLIRGEAGIGKSRLLGELSTRAPGRQVLRARGAELRRGEPYALLGEALRDPLLDIGAARLDRMTGALAELSRVVPELAPAGRARGSALYRAGTHRAISEVLGILARRTPLVLCLDDVQWADDATVEGLEALVRRPPEAPLLLVLAVRPRSEGPALRRVLAHASEQDRLHTVELGPLGAAEVDELTTALGAAADPGLVQTSGGNPFYLEQLIRSRGPVTAQPDSGGVPAPVRMALESELSRLAPAAAALLDGAAIAGDPFTVDQALAAARGTATIELLDELVAADLIRRDHRPQTWRFRHPLVHAAVLERIPDPTRRQAHGALADALAAAGAAAPARAPHLVRSGRHDEATIYALAQAGMDQLDFAPASAGLWLAHALDLIGPEGDARLRGMLLAPLAFTHAAGGRYDEAGAALEEATRLFPSAPGRAVLVTLRCGLEQLRGRHINARMLSEEALRAGGSADRVSRALLQLVRASCHLYESEYARGWDYVRPVVEQARSLHDLPLELDAAALAACFGLQMGAPADAIKHLERGIAVAARMSDQQHASRPTGLMYLGYAAYFADRVGLAVELFTRSLEIHRSAGRQPIEVVLSIGLALALAPAGRLGQAREVIDDAWRLAEAEGTAQARAWVRLAEATIAAEDGRLAHGVACAEEAMALVPQLEAEVMRQSVSWAAGTVFTAAGRVADARAALGLIGAGDRDIVGTSSDRQAHRAELLAESALLDGDLPEARRWTVAAQHHATRSGLLGPRAHAQRAAARLALAEERPADAVVFARNGATDAEHAGRLVDAAGCRLLQARALLAKGDAHAARAVLEPLHVQLLGFGAHTHAEAVAALLRQAGGRRGYITPEAARANTDRLTDKQLRVARLVATGATNREIGAALHLSERTVESHVSAIRSTLGVSSRAAIAALFAETAPVPDPVPQQAALTLDELDAPARRLVQALAVCGTPAEQTLLAAVAELDDVAGAAAPLIERGLVSNGDGRLACGALDLAAVADTTPPAWAHAAHLRAAAHLTGAPPLRRAVHLVHTAQLGDVGAGRELAAAARDAAAGADAPRWAQAALRVLPHDDPDRAALEQLAAKPAPAAREAVVLLPELTDRERDVALLVADGHGNKEVAERLGIGARTVETHLSRCYLKLGVRRRAELAAHVAARRDAEEVHHRNNSPPKLFSPRQ